MTSFRHRIRTIYRKELLDILRDRRTLIAMIVVPIVLYPLLMIGSIQAVSYQVESLQQEKILLGVINDAQMNMLRHQIQRDAVDLERIRRDLNAGSRETETLPASLDSSGLLVFSSTDELTAAIRNRQVHVGVVFAEDRLVDAFDHKNRVQILADQEETRSAAAAKRVEDMFRRIGKRTGEDRLHSVGLPKEIVEFFTISFVNLSSPPSILGQILPLILVLMTITGAIYPAIDLTAGERERGTLESLMVCPIAVLDLIVGKFLVVTTIAVMGAALNLASVSATVYFGGFQKVIATSGDGVPVAKMAFILLALIPFAVLMSAIMIAVCSFARTFKEAQNYVTPVIFAVLIPGGIAALPTTKLEGIMLVMPVGNMVLLARDLLLGAVVSLGHIATVLLSTTLYAAAAVAVAANLFGQEAVLFSDVGSLKTLLSRRLRKPRARPTVSMSLLFAALLFPVWFFIQSALSPTGTDSAAGQIIGTGLFMPLFFVLAPLLCLVYAKIDLCETLGVRWPAGRYVAAAVLMGLSAWVPAFEINALQQMLLPLPAPVMESLARFQESIKELDPTDAFLYLALIPAICEELFFRGLLLRSLLSAGRPWTALAASAVVFGVFHFVAFRFVLTFLLGLVLAYLCWKSRSIVPGVILHVLHNAGAVSAVYWPWHEKLGIQESGTHLPWPVIISGCVIFAVGLVLASRSVWEKPNDAG